MIQYKINGREITLIENDQEDLTIDMDDILSIHTDNILGEILTMPLLVNQIGRLKGQADIEYRTAQFEFECYKANIANNYRKKNAWSDKGPTVSEIEHYVLSDQGVILKQKAVLKKQEALQTFDSLYRSVLSKDSKISGLTKAVSLDTLQGQLEFKLNGILVSINK